MALALIEVGRLYLGYEGNLREKVCYMILIPFSDQLTSNKQ